MVILNLPKKQQMSKRSNFNVTYPKTFFEVTEYVHFPLKSPEKARDGEPERRLRESHNRPLNCDVNLAGPMIMRAHAPSSLASFPIEWGSPSEFTRQIVGGNKSGSK